LTTGMLVADRRPLRPARKATPNARVALDVEAGRFLELFLSRLQRP
jgi:inosine-uridine nucleoside N-ribohydrolase